MTIAAVVILALLAFLVFRFIAGLVKFGLIAIIVIVALWFIVGRSSGMPLPGGLH